MSTERGLSLAVLAFDGAMLSSIAGPVDALRIARRIAELRGPAEAPRIEARVHSARDAREVTVAGGLTLSTQPWPDEDPDVVLVPGVMHDSPGHLLGRTETLAPEIHRLRELAARGVTLAGVCSGTFLLAAAGLLDGRRATTSWWLDVAFRKRFPLVKLEPDAMVVEDGPVLTAGAATAVLTLMLRLVARAGGEDLAKQTGCMLAIDTERQSQAPYVSRALIEQPRSSMTEKATRFLQRELHREISIAELAVHCGTSERSLLRHFREQFGTGPLAHVQHLRVERAKALLESTQLSFEEIVGRCGYRDVASFRKLFKRATSLTPLDYRSRFRLRARA